MRSGISRESGLLRLAAVLSLSVAACDEPGADEREMAAEKIHGGPVTAVAFSPDGFILASASEDDTIRLMDVSAFHGDQENPNDTLAMMVELSRSPLLGLGTGFRSLAFSPDGSHVAGGNYRFVQGGVMLEWDIKTEDEPLEISGYVSPVRGISYSPDGASLAGGSGNPYEAGEVSVWLSGQAGAPQHVAHFISGVNGVAYSADGSLLAAACEDGTIRVWRTSDWADLRTLEADDHTPRAIVFSPDGKRLVSAGDDSGPGFWGQGGVLRIFEIETGDLVASLDIGSGALRAAAYSPDGSLLAVGGDGNVIELIDPVMATGIDTLTGHGERVNAVAFSSNGQILASGSDDQYVRLWWVGDLVGSTCGDGVDNDGDGWTDGDDPDCEDGDREVGYSEHQCNDGADNDDDGHEDAADPDCENGADDDETAAPQDGGTDGGDAG